MSQAQGPAGAPSGPPRVEPLTDWPTEIGSVLAKTRLENGRPLAIFRTLARHPALLRRYNVLGGCFQVDSLLPPAVRELVVLRVAARLSSAYELDRHLPVAERVGLSAGEISAILSLGAADQGSPLTDVQRRLIELADELVEDDDVSDACWAAVHADWDDAQMLELVMLAGFYRMTALYLRSVRMPLEGSD